MRDISNLKGKIFRHFKGDLYLVEDFVKHSETQETMVNPTGQKYRFQEYEVKSVK